MFRWKIKWVSTIFTLSAHIFTLETLGQFLKSTLISYPWYNYPSIHYNVYPIYLHGTQHYYFSPSSCSVILPLMPGTYCSPTDSLSVQQCHCNLPNQILLFIVVMFFTQHAILKKFHVLSPQFSYLLYEQLCNDFLLVWKLTNSLCWAVELALSPPPSSYECIYTTGYCCDKWQAGYDTMIKL